MTAFGETPRRGRAVASLSNDGLVPFVIDRGDPLHVDGAAPAGLRDGVLGCWSESIVSRSRTIGAGGLALDAAR